MLMNCRSCESDSLALTVTRKKFPLYIWPLPKIESSRLEDIKLYVCNECGHMQLQNIDSKTISEIYREEVFNIDNPEQNISRYGLISKNNPNKFINTKVLEIGGGRNSFITVLPKQTEKWVVDFSIEESIKSNLEGNYTGDFNELIIKETGFDFIFMFHVLEHFNNPNKALNKIRKLLKKKGSLIIEVPNFEFEIQKYPYYTLFHMHISLFSDSTLISMMKKHGFSCINYYKKDEVLLAEFALANKIHNDNHKQHSIKLIESMQLNIEKSYSKLKAILKNIGEEKVVIFGAGGTSTLFLYSFPFMIKKVSYAIDNNEKKWGRYICAGKIPVISFKDFLNQGINYVIILEDNHSQYFKNNNRNNLINIGNFYDS